MAKTKTYYCSLTKEQKKAFIAKLNNAHNPFKKEKEPEVNETVEEGENNG